MSAQSQALLVGGRRTPVGKYGGALSSVRPDDLAALTVKAVIEDAGIDPGRVVFEVVESDEVRDTAHLLDILSTYRAAGFRVALDDVGAGYSSLGLLARLRPDFVKLDMGLVRGVDADPYKAQVAGKLVEMARGLGVETVVERVETAGAFFSTGRRTAASPRLGSDSRITLYQADATCLGSGPLVYERPYRWNRSLIRGAISL